MTTLCLGDLNLDPCELLKIVEAEVDSAGLAHASISNGDFVLDVLSTPSKYLIEQVKCSD